MGIQAGQCSEQVFPWQVDADQRVSHREEQPATLQAAEGAHRPEDCSMYQRQAVRVPRPNDVSARFCETLLPPLPLEKSREMLQEILKVVLYKGNTGHQEVLRTEGKCGVYDPVPLVLVKDIMTYMPQMKYMFSSIASEPSNKRQRVN